MQQSGASVVPLTQKTRAEYQGSGDNTLRNPVVQQGIQRHFNRTWADNLSDHEYRVLGFILDQTVNWGKAERVFSYRFMEVGDNLTVGTKKSKRQLVRIIATLEQKGIISVDRTDTTKGLTIKVNLGWIPENDMLPMPKRVKMGQEEATYTSPEDSEGWESGVTDVTPPVSPMSPPRCHGRHPIKEELFREEHSEEPVSAMPADAANRSRISGSTLLPVANRRRPRPSSPEKNPSPQIPPAPPSRFDPEEYLKARVAERDKKHEKVLKPGAIERTYRHAFEDAFADHPGMMPAPFTVVQLGKVKQVFCKRWTGSPEELHDFFRWIVTEWQVLRGSVFGFMKRSPSPMSPDIDFICRYSAKLRNAYTARRTDSWLKEIDDHERRRYAELTVKQAMSPETARMKIAEERAKEQLRDELRESKEAANARLRAARAAEESAKRMRAPRPVHPESIVAKEQRREEYRRDMPDMDPDEAIRLLSEAASIEFKED